MVRSCSLHTEAEVQGKRKGYSDEKVNEMYLPWGSAQYLRTTEIVD